MNKIIAVSLFICFVFNCKAQSDSLAPKGNEKCRLMHYKKTETDSTIITNETYSYNEEGKLIEIEGLGKTIKSAYDKTGNMIRHTEYVKYKGKMHKITESKFTYNSKNQLIRQVYSRGSPQEEFKKDKEFIYEYYAKGHTKKDFMYNGDSQNLLGVHCYNEKGYVFNSEFPNGSFIKTEYDSMSKIIKRTYYHAIDKKVSEHILDYNSQNQLVRSSKRIDGVLNSSISYEYNSYGKETSVTSYDGAGTMEYIHRTDYTGENYTRTTYNSKNEAIKYEEFEMLNGLVLKKSYYADKKLNYYIVYTYDEYKNLVKKELFTVNKKGVGLEEWSYTCD